MSSSSGFWIPFDATEEEVAELRIVRDDIPDGVRTMLDDWVLDHLSDGYSSVSVQTGQRLQSTFRLNLGITSARPPSTKNVLGELYRMGGDRLVLRVVDWFLSQYEPGFSGPPQDVLDLAVNLSLSGAAVRVKEKNGTYRLTRLFPKGVEQAAEEAAIAAGASASRHLVEAWNAINAVEPNPKEAFSEGIKAVELAVHEVVLPKAKKVRLSQSVQALKDKKDWALVLATRDDNYPNHREVLIGMLETLVFAQNGRHGGDPNNLEEARAHVMLASLLVGWFATGAVVMEPRSP